MPNVDYPNGFKAVAPFGTTLPIYEYFTKSNLTVTAGDAMILLSTGVVDIALAASTSILGVCQSVVTGTAGVQKKVLIVPAAKGIVFSGQCSGTYTPVNAGEAVDIEGGTGVMEINENAQAVGVATIVGLEGGIDNEVGANARVLFTWTKSAW